MQLTRRGFVALSSAVFTTHCAPNVIPSQDADVIVLGAGLAGLHAARMLEADGFKVLVLEAASVVGGRMQTLDDLPGRPEAGGQQVGQSYARIRSTALDLGINIVPPKPGGSRAKTMVFDGKVFDARDWAARPENPFPDPFKSATPDSALFRAAIPDNPLADQYAWREANTEFDISAETFLRSKGFDAASLALCNVALNGNALRTYSMLNLWRSLTLFALDSSSGGSEDIEGGAQRLPEAMAASLSEGAVRLNTSVSAITSVTTGVEIRAGKFTFRAPFCVNTLPFPVLRKMSLTEDGASPAIAPIINAMPYTQIQQVHLEIESGPDDDLPMMMWTDTPIERVFPVRNESGETVSLTCWINGDGIRPATSDADWKTLAEQTLRDTRGIRAKARAIVRWDKDQPLSGGAYMHWAPGQIQPWAERITQSASRMHYAGEHTSYLHTGMEGAMESGERAAYAIIEAAAASTT